MVCLRRSYNASAKMMLPVLFDLNLIRYVRGIDNLDELRSSITTVLAREGGHGAGKARSGRVNTWIFQANPDQFDIDGYLATAPATIHWLVRQHGTEMRAGDQVFIWRAKSKGDAKLSGIVAEGFLESTPEVREDDPDGLPFWLDGAPKPELRVRVRLARIELKERFQRNWLDYDPVMVSATILTLRAGTNFRLTEQQASRLNSLWRRAKVGWTYAEVVAGMWAFKRTLGGQVSRLPGTPVAVAAMRTGRVVQGMYNKVQHFRAMDPNDPRAGLTSNSIVDRQVWAKFFDGEANRIRDDEIEAEFARLWPDESVGLLPPQPSADAAAALLSGLTLAELLARYSKGSKDRPLRPRTYPATTTAFARDPLVVAIGRVRAGHRCEVPECAHTLFTTADGTRFVEIHHIEPLAEGGPDTPENVACVCPSHHREAHHGTDASAIRAALQTKRSKDTPRAIAA